MASRHDALAASPVLGCLVIGPCLLMVCRRFMCARPQVTAEGNGPSVALTGWSCPMLLEFR